MKPAFAFLPARRSAVPGASSPAASPSVAALPVAALPVVPLPVSAAAPAAESAPARPAHAWPGLALLWAGAVLCVGAAVVQGGVAARTPVDAELVNLLRGMAVIKGGLALVAAAAISWRLFQPGPRLPLLAYCIGVWLMAAASVLVWQQAAVGLAAGAFHVGEFTVLIAAWRDGRRRR